MSNYQMWNASLASYLVEGVQRGMEVFLRADDEILRRVGHDMLGLRPEDAIPAFCASVRQQVVLGSNRIDLRRVQGHDPQGIPMGVAFLASMVLAAARMDEGEEFSSINYFGRFREVLELAPGDGRPPGMLSGMEAEEPLWRNLVIWLQQQGFLSTARAGDGPTKYVNYPISQALLRDSDKKRLRRLIVDKHWPPDWDVETLTAHVRREAPYLTQHLREMLTVHGQRDQAIADAIYDVYEACQVSAGAAGGSRRIFGDLFRSEQALTGNIEYCLYPRVPRALNGENVIVSISDVEYVLKADRPGWFAPVMPITQMMLEQGQSFPIERSTRFDCLILPRRRFWILIPDPENPEYGAYASWGRPRLGTPFILLCKRELVPTLDSWRAAQLLEWQGNPMPVFEDTSWAEIQGCMVISQAWTQSTDGDQELFDALRPSVALSISLSGGLRVPGLGGWLDSYGPAVTVFGFQSEADVLISDVATYEQIMDQPQPINAPFTVPWPRPGDYLIEASCAGQTDERLVKLAGWQELKVEHEGQPYTTKIGGSQICGAALVEDPEGS